jgi:hypothetical protein
VGRTRKEVEGGEGEPIIVNHQRSVIVKFINFVPSRLVSRFFRRLGASPLFSIVLFVFLTPKESSRRFISSSLSTHTSESSNFIIVATVSCHSLCSHSDLVHRLPGTQRQAGRQSQWARQRKNEPQAGTVTTSLNREELSALLFSCFS